MWSINTLTERLNLKWPILQAPMGSASTPALAAAVTNAGGLGGLGMWGRSAIRPHAASRGFGSKAAGVSTSITRFGPTRAAHLTPAGRCRNIQVQYDAFGLGRVPEPAGEVSDVGPEHVALMLETKPEVVSFHFGLPAPEVIRALKVAGTFILSSATTVAEARLLEEQGVDAIIAQGTEAGGHRATFTGIEISMQSGLFSLLPQIVNAVRVPVIAAGGVADGRTAAAAFMLGASAVELGTAFLRCEEADVRDAHRATLAEADDACTVVTDVISGRPCRYIRNKLIDDLMASGLKPLPVPAQQSLTQRLGDTGNREWTTLTSGQSAALARATKAAELIERLADETTRRLRAFAERPRASATIHLREC